MAEAEASGDASAEMWRNRKWRMELLFNHHAKFSLNILQVLSSSFEEYDTQRMTFVQFAVTSLDLLKKTDALKDTGKKRIIEWIYHLQISGEPVERCGFQGSTTLLLKSKTSSDLPVNIFSSHITMTYAALVTLLTLGDDLSRVDRASIMKGLVALQNSDGSFKASLGCPESDMRFVYCAMCICYILNDFSQINVPTLLQFIKQSFTYEGSFTSGYSFEGHAAYTFCAVASLSMLGKVHEVFSKEEIRRLTKWCLSRQESGFTGRPNKSEDTCYSYWVGGTLKILDSLSYIDRESNVDFVLGNQNPLTGGIGKYDNDYSDPLHTFLGLAGLSLVDYEGLNTINPQLTMTENAVKHLKTLQKSWEQDNQVVKNQS